MRWASNGTDTCGRQAAITSGPKVRLGTKRPSITSHWMRSTPAFSSATTSSPRRRSRQAGRRVRSRRRSCSPRHPEVGGAEPRRPAGGHRAGGRRRGRGPRPSGRVVFVEGALPGERVRVAVTDERRHHARCAGRGGRVRPGPGDPTVRARGRGLRRLRLATRRPRRPAGAQGVHGGRGPRPPRRPGCPRGGARAGPAHHRHRTSLRGVADADGRFSLRRHHSHDLVAVPACLVAHPRLAEVAAEGRFPPGSEVTIRVGARTGDRMVIIDHPSDPTSAPLDDPEVPPVRAEAERVGDRGRRAGRGAGGDRGQLADGRRAWLFEVVAGVRLRVSARSFFRPGRTRPRRWWGRSGRRWGRATRGRPVRGRGPVRGDRRAWGAGGRGRGVRLRRGRRPGQPGRRGRQGGAQRRGPLAGAGGRGRGGRPAPGGTGATGRAGRGRHPGEADRAGQLRCRGLGRDTRLLRESGYAWTGSTLVDAFPHTPHVEVVSRFARIGGVSHGHACLGPVRGPGAARASPPDRVNRKTRRTRGRSPGRACRPRGSRPGACARCRRWRG